MKILGRSNFKKKIALILSLCAIIAYAFMGTGSSLAWFSDEDTEVQNIFHFAEFDLEVFYRTEDGSWEDLEGKTEIFDREALYEPGFTQVVYLKIRNNGNVPFLFNTAISVMDYTEAVNYFGQSFLLHEYLRFGVIPAPTEDAMDAKVANRELAIQQATQPLNNYATDSAELEAYGETYMALVVHMPEIIGNNANYRKDQIPRVELGIIVEATQKKP